MTININITGCEVHIYNTQQQEQVEQVEQDDISNYANNELITDMLMQDEVEEDLIVVQQDGTEVVNTAKTAQEELTAFRKWREEQ